MNKTSSKIALLNDSFRHTGRHLLFSLGVLHFNDQNLFRLDQALQNYTNFTKQTDPHGEHDFGVFTWENQQVIWKICYYDLKEIGPCDPLSPHCQRILYVMLKQEYYDGKHKRN